MHLVRGTPFSGRSGPGRQLGTHEEAGVRHAGGGDVGARLLGAGSGSRDDGSSLRGKSAGPAGQQSGRSFGPAGNERDNRRMGWVGLGQSAHRSKGVAQESTSVGVRGVLPAESGLHSLLVLAAEAGSGADHLAGCRGKREGRTRDYLLSSREPLRAEADPLGREQGRCLENGQMHAPTRFSARASREDRLPRKEDPERRVTRARVGPATAD